MDKFEKRWLRKQTPPKQNKRQSAKPEIPKPVSLDRLLAKPINLENFNTILYELYKPVGIPAALDGDGWEEEHEQAWKKILRAAKPDWLEVAIALLVTPADRVKMSCDHTELAEFLGNWAYQKPDLVLPPIAQLLEEEETRTVALLVFAYSDGSAYGRSNPHPEKNSIMLRYLRPWYTEKLSLLSEEQVLHLIDAIAMSSRTIDVSENDLLVETIGQSLPEEYTQAREQVVYWRQDTNANPPETGG